MIGVGTLKITEKARQYVNEVLVSERLSYGPFTQKFERLFAASHDSRFAVMTNSGTSSLLIALAALKIKYNWQDGDEVIVPAVTFIATSNIVLQLNMRPVFVDVDPVFYEIDPARIEAAITERTRCIIPVHMFGLPCDMDPIMAIAQRHNLRVIEDSCQAMFVKYKGRSVGSFGDIGCFSTYVAHILTSGVGGLCVTSDPSLAVQLRSLMNHGRDSIYLSIDDDDNKSSEEMEMIIQRRFSFVQMGYSFRLTEMEGALALAEFENREETTTKRIQNGYFFQEKLARWNHLLQLPSVRQEASHAFMMFPVVLRDSPKDALVRHLEENGIETREMCPLINQPVYKDLDLKLEDYPVATWINQNGFYFGCHQGLTDHEKKYMVEVIDAFFEKKQIQKEMACLILMSKACGEVAKNQYDLLSLDLFEEKFFVEGSEDPSASDFYKKKGFTIVQGSHPKGALLKKAIDLTAAENIIILGADGSDDPRDVSSLLVKLKQGFDVVVASRFTPGGTRTSNRPFTYRSLGNRFFSFLLGVIYRRNITDCNNLYRAVKKSVFEKLELSENGEGIMFEMTVKALSSDFKLAECPTSERPALSVGKKRNRFLSALSLFRILLREQFTGSGDSKSDARR